MTEIELPPIRPRLPVAVVLERVELGGHSAFTVTSWSGFGRQQRRFFSDRGLALAYAADKADAHGLPLLATLETEL